MLHHASSTLLQLSIDLSLYRDSRRHQLAYLGYVLGAIW